MTESTHALSVTARLMALAARRSGLDVNTIDRQAPLAELGIDSLGMAELMFDIDDEFDVEITDEQIAGLTHVDSLIALIEAQLAARATA